MASAACIRALDLAESSFTSYAESVRALQAAVNAIAVGNQSDYQAQMARYQAAHAQATPPSAMSADIASCRALAKVAPAGPAEVSPASCLRSLDLFATAFDALGGSGRGLLLQAEGYTNSDSDLVRRGRDTYAEAFARVREVDAPLRADHTDCRRTAAADATSRAATSSIAAPTTTPSTWRMVAQFKGQTRGLTAPYTTTRTWRLTYLVNELLVVNVRAGDKAMIVDPGLSVANSSRGRPLIGSRTFTMTGTFYLDIYSWGYYQIDIEEPN